MQLPYRFSFLHTQMYEKKDWFCFFCLVKRNKQEKTKVMKKMKHFLHHISHIIIVCLFVFIINNVDDSFPISNIIIIIINGDQNVPRWLTNNHHYYNDDCFTNWHWLSWTNLRERKKTKNFWINRIKKSIQI